MLELRNIEKIYNKGTVNEHCIFKDFNLKIEDGTFMSVIGSNGSGKTSLLNIICGSIDIDYGNVLINGEDITLKKEYLRHRSIGRVYQDPSKGTCPSMNIIENMAIADNKGKPYNLRMCVNRNRVNHYKEILRDLNLGLEDKTDVPVGALSGGQRQALSLVMATMNPLKFLILDEHTAALDPRTAEIIMELTNKIVLEKGVTTIMVTHNLKYAVEYGNRLFMMHEGNAVLDKVGEEKASTKVDDILDLFYEISLEYGN